MRGDLFSNDTFLSIVARSEILRFTQKDTEDKVVELKLFLLPEHPGLLDFSKNPPLILRRVRGVMEL